MQRSFYFWRTEFNLSAKEKHNLSALQVNDLYTRLFDVAWNEEAGLAEPVGIIRFNEPPPPGIRITPVIFISNQTLSNTPSSGIDSLSIQITRLAETLIRSNGLNTSGEVQIDCDWTRTTKERYFYLLRSIRQSSLLRGKILSATIRLHQLKFVSETGVPPVDKGLLMAYNMGNLLHPQTTNSIIDSDEMRKYIRNMNEYPLMLDIALPVFDWFVLFRDHKFAGLIHRLPWASLQRKGGYTFERDTVIDGHRFTQKDRIRYEGSTAGEIMECAHLLKSKLRRKKLNIILYHLDEYHLSKYTPDELEGFYNSFR